jgi:hypothetical protein
MSSREAVGDYLDSLEADIIETPYWDAVYEYAYEYAQAVVLPRITHIHKAMRPDVTLSNGRIVSHKPYLSAGKPNGATEAYMQDGGNMSNEEWKEYVSLLKEEV